MSQCPHEEIKQNVLIDAEIADFEQERHPKIQHVPDPSRDAWLKGGYLQGYMFMSRMQYEAALQMLKLQQKQSEAQARTNKLLLAEISSLNKMIQKISNINEQLQLDFDALRKRVESVLIRL